MNNKPVAWMTKKSLESLSIPFLSQVTLMTALKASQVDDFNIPLYTQEQLEEARKLGMQQERALWNLSESTQEFESFDRTASHMAGEYVAHSIRELTKQEIDKIESMCSVNEQGQINGREFANLILKKASEL